MYLNDEVLFYKHRSALSEIIAKYRQKCAELQHDIKDILEEERTERELRRIENQANRAENAVKGEKQPKRSWFQSLKEREEEKGRCKYPFQ